MRPRGTLAGYPTPRPLSPWPCNGLLMNLSIRCRSSISRSVGSQSISHFSLSSVFSPFSSRRHISSTFLFNCRKLRIDIDEALEHRRFSWQQPFGLLQGSDGGGALGLFALSACSSAWTLPAIHLFARSLFSRGRGWFFAINGGRPTIRAGFDGESRRALISVARDERGLSSGSRVSKHMFLREPRDFSGGLLTVDRHW